MSQNSKEEGVWPYILPFPLDPLKRELIWKFLQSRVGLKILGEVVIDKKTYQHDLIEKLPYSNKSVIKYLKKMGHAAVLEHGMEAKVEKGRTVWLKWYKPTSLGKWLILFLKPPREVPPDLTKNVIEELFHLYASSIVEATQRYGLDIESFHRHLDKECLRELVRRQPHRELEVAVFGSVALDTYGRLKRLPTYDGATYVEEIGRHPGGMGANVAIALSKLNISSSFFGKIGSDSTGRLLLQNLRKNHVDISNIKIVEGPSLRTLILKDDRDHRWLFTIGSSQSAISLTSLDEINWKPMERAKIVYVGEVFTEIASTIADHASARGKLVVYRPGEPFMKFGVEVLGKILEHTTIFILNQPSWRELVTASTQKLRSPADLLKKGPEHIILTKESDGCELFSQDRHLEFPVDHQLQSKFHRVDPTGAGDSFSAALIKGLLRNWTIEKSITYAQAAAAITTSIIGTSRAFPTEKEVDAATLNA